jgi:hypothetical protein
LGKHSENQRPQSFLPDNPLKKAKEQYMKMQAMRSTQVGIGYLSGLANMERYLASVPNIHALMNRVPLDYSNWVDENVIHVRINGLLQTRQRRFNDFVIAALACGDFIARASIISAEYKQQEKIDISIKVTNEVAK